MYFQKPSSNEYTQSTKVPGKFSLVTGTHSQSAVAAHRAHSLCSDSIAQLIILQILLRVASRVGS